MNLAWYALWFIVAVSLLVTVHEFGHYWVARRLGFKVLRFSIGFGKPIYYWRRKGDDTEYVLSALPLGGYVKMLDEREGPVPSADLARSFTRKPPWQRIAVLLAGPAFNIAFAILVLWGMFWASGITEFKPVVGDVLKDSIAAHGGLRSGDEILTINGAAVVGQRDVMFDLLDAVSSHGVANLTVRGKDGSTRSADLNVPDHAQRVRLTEPAALLHGLNRFFHRIHQDLIADGFARYVQTLNQRHARAEQGAQHPAETRHGELRGQGANERRTEQKSFPDTLAFF